MWNVRESSPAESLHPGYMRRPVDTSLLPEILPRPIRGSIALAASAVALGGILHALPAQAVDFSAGELEGSFDTTLSHGMTFRVGKRDENLVARSAGGMANSANFDDGNLNYKRSLASNTSKFTSELDLRYRDFGAFARVHGFLDFENENSARERTELSSEAMERVGKDLDVLDLYVTGAFDVGDAPLDVRLGKHVLNWGESTFIQNGINVINPFDVSKLRTPGAELRDALTPVPMVSASVSPTDALSLEGFYQLGWEKTEIDPVGSYFSTTDIGGAGARKAVLGFGKIPDSGLAPTSNIGFERLIPLINQDLEAYRNNIQAQQEKASNLPRGSLTGRVPPHDQKSTDPDFLSVLRDSDREPDDSGQWGVALRYLAEDLNDTEFGFYFTNYHSRLPLLSARTGTPAGVRSGLVAAGALRAPGSKTVAAVQKAVTDAVTEDVRKAVVAAVPPGTPPQVIQQRIIAGVSEQTSKILAEVTRQVSTIAGSLATDRYAKTARYFTEYPEDLQLFGLSFNTQLGTSGWALQGEYSHRRAAPLQIDDVELLLAGLTPLTVDPGTLKTLCAQSSPFSARYCTNQIGKFDPDSYIRGYIERNVSQIQATATRLFGPTLGADGMVFVAEAALMHVHDMPDKNILRLEGPGTATSGNPFHTGATGAHPGLPEEPADRFPDATSFGYRMAARLDYNNAVGAVNLSPRVQFQHDVNGTSPGPGGPFVEGRYAVTLGLGASYLDRWQADLSYTRFAGAGRYNLLHDRDFVSATVKYSF